MGVSGAGGFRCGSVRSAQRGWCWDCVRGIVSSQFGGMGYSWISHFFCKFTGIFDHFLSNNHSPIFGAVLFFSESLESLNTILIDGWSLLGYIAIWDRTWTDHISQSPSTFWVHIFLATTFHPWNLCLYNLVSNFGCHDIQRSTSSNVLHKWMGMKWCVPHFQKKQLQFEHWIRWSFKFRQVFLGPHRCLLLTFPFLLLSPFPPNITNRNHTNPLV